MAERWRQRFEHFEKAYILFAEAMENDIEALSELEEMGCVQAFEIMTELAWKVMKDVLEHEGVALGGGAPKAVVKDAFAFGLVEDGQAWVDILNARNVLAHQYDRDKFVAILRDLQDSHLDEFAALHKTLKDRING